MKTIKKVNISAPKQIHNVLPLPIIGDVKGLNLDTDQIYTCLCKGATVKEILSNGTEVVLGVSNYFTNNEVHLDNQEKMEAKNVTAAKVNTTTAEDEAAKATKKLAEETAAAKEKFQKEALNKVAEEPVVVEETSVEEPVVETASEEVKQPTVEKKNNQLKKK